MYSPFRHQRSVVILGALLGVVVLLLSLLLFEVVGLGEAYRTYPRFQLDTLAAQGEMVTSSMQGFVLAGLPLAQFPGFATLTQPLLASDRAIAAISVTDAQGQTVFINAQPGSVAFADPALFQPSAFQDAQHTYTVTENATLYCVTLPIKSKFEQVGSLRVFMPKAAITEAINARFVWVTGACALLVCAYSLAWTFVQRRTAAGGDDRRVRWQSGIYGLACLLMAAVVIGALVHLYADGVQSKAQSLARALQLRLLAPLDMGLDLADFNGLDDAFKANQALNPDISSIALTRNDRIVVATDASRVGTLLVPRAGEIEYRLPLQTTAQATSADRDEIHVAIPTSVIYATLWRSVKNFVVLFIASAFLAALFFNLMRSFTTRHDAVFEQAHAAAWQIGLIKPFYFLSVFIEGLTTSFLPQYFGGLARASGVSVSLVSLLFTAYFTAFVFALIPAGRFAERRGNKPLLLLAACIVTMSQVLMVVVTDFYVMIGVRALAGLAQGMLYIGVQSFLLERAAAHQKTRGAAVIVYGYNGGMIAGTAIGALLTVYLGVRSVFVVSGIIALCLIPYIARFVPQHQPAPAATPGSSFFFGLRNAVRDVQFMKAMLLIGIPAKAILTGVTIFALPLLLAQQHYAQEDIGQIIMLYSMGVLVSSTYVSRLVDTFGKTTRVLFVGAFVSGIGLVLIGLMGWHGVASLSALTLNAGMIVLGLAHGCIHAPIVTHIANTHATQTLGKSTTASLYRLLERGGHMAGPMLVSYILLLNGGSAVAVAWIGLVVIILSLLFMLKIPQCVVPTPRPEQLP